MVAMAMGVVGAKALPPRVSNANDDHVNRVENPQEDDFVPGEVLVKFKDTSPVTIRKTGEAEGRYIKQTGGHGQYGDVWIRFEPNPGKGFEFVDAIVGGSVPKEFIKPTQQGLEDALQRGVLAGYPLIDLKATLFDGSYHDVDSSEAAYKVAASMALKAAAPKCDPVILEPIMKVEITVPEQYYGDVIGDIARRRGNMVGETQRGNAKEVECEVPLAEMFGYVTDLRSITQGRGNFTMQFDHYGETPRFVQDAIIKKATGGK